MLLYKVETSYREDFRSIEDIIQYTFRNFSTQNLDFFEPKESLYFDSFKQAFDWESWTGNDISSLMIIEYNFTEEDLFFIIVNEYICKPPINIKYYIWNTEDSKLKEISKLFV